MEPSQNLSALFEKFLVYLQSEPVPPEFLGSEPIEVPPDFDPYQMVAEWIALRHELKQQGKILRSAKDTFEQSLDALQAQSNLAISQQDASASRQSTATDKEQESLFRDLLNVMDAIDQACDHWEEIQADRHQEPYPVVLPKPRRKRKPWWQVVFFWWKSDAAAPDPQPSASHSLDLEIVNSSRTGLELIRRNLLDLLKSRQVIPMDALGKPFDARCMYAIGRESNHQFAPNTVVREVVRGYYWGERILREAQVIVAAPKE